jgi:HEAT repeat protein
MKKSVILFLLAVTVFGLAAQESETTRRITLEERFLSTRPELALVGQQAETGNRETKLIALQTIQGLIEDGKVSSGDQLVHEVLQYLSIEGTGRIVYEAGLQINYFPMVRKEACNLLGQMGGEQARITLLSVLSRDPEPMVLSEAAYALGQIGFNENNEVSTALAEAVLNQDPVLPDNNFGYTSLLVFEKLAERNNGLNDPNAFRAIIQIAQGNYIKVVREKALEVLTKLREY